jgi:hypothetical protein
VTAQRSLRRKVLPKRGRKLLVQRLENVSRDLFARYAPVVREHVRGKTGIYALYRNNKLYYVGLASDLRSRLKAHIRNRHSGNWDTFSLYLTGTGEHIRELEALLLRITMPTGNRVKSRLAHAEDLRPVFKRWVEESHQKEVAKLFGEMRMRSGSRKRSRKASQSELAAILKGSLPIRLTYKGKTFKATARRNGTIRLGSRVFQSPSQAAGSIIPRSVNGWYKWRYKSAAVSYTL